MICTFFNIGSIAFAPLVEQRTLSATDPDCGVNAIVNYTLGETPAKVRQFSIKPDSGELCVAAPLDHETFSNFEFPVLATDRAGAPAPSASARRVGARTHSSCAGRALIYRPRAAAVIVFLFCGCNFVLGDGSRETWTDTAA
ncbi:Protein dachsous [Eumeta japonica]|uniref:Protein dachsous n=1 Tax=Eumeta variegata TaxID=151549 RepID=A0A4C1ZDT7_EUMVA|nr:Protein dachsous [Eumeta japonica]